MVHDILSGHLFIGSAGGADGCAGGRDYSDGAWNGYEGHHIPIDVSGYFQWEDGGED